MTFFLVKTVEEVAEGDLSGAWSTLTGGIAPEVTTIEADAATAFQAFLTVAGPSVAKTLLTSAAAAITNGLKTGIADLETGLVSAAEAGGEAAAGAL
jgi:hypothetical protein